MAALSLKKTRTEREEKKVAVGVTALPELEEIHRGAPLKQERRKGSRTEPGEASPVRELTEWASQIGAGWAPSSFCSLSFSDAWKAVANPSARAVGQEARVRPPRRVAAMVKSLAQIISLPLDRSRSLQLVGHQLTPGVTQHQSATASNLSRGTADSQHLQAEPEESEELGTLFQVKEPLIPGPEDREKEQTPKT
ncbi:hypothetical protein Cadr_000010188 [Camelus dromedarius]|uniref:Uncharacterized protein n=1 Tax=Camelus dromedarius TaxID=9838 RepID=A0A5N4DW13_CAMDR|nr:hypothetical protein Cadr_000010188 [Camelus dromedarius]